MNRLLPQSGIGIELRGENLCAFYAKRFWKRVRIVDCLEIPDFRKAGSAECGRRYREFLRKNGLKAPWTVVALPRSQVLVRTLHFPTGMEKDLAAAVALQLDVLHPFEEGSVVWDFAADAGGNDSGDGQLRGTALERNGSGCNVLVGIAQRSVVEEWAGWFHEAGIAVSQFTLSATLLLTTIGAAFRKQSPGSSSFFVLHAREDGCELLGHAAGMPILSREIAWSASGMEPEAQGRAVARELELARSELRLDPGERPALLLCGAVSSIRSGLESAEFPIEVSSVDPLLPIAKESLANISLAENVLGVAAAAAAAEHGPSLSMNLLPAERRSYESATALVPTYALASAVLFLAVALGLRGPVQDWSYSRYLERERQGLAPDIQQLEHLQGASRETMTHLATLGGFRQAGALPLGLLDELTRILPPDAWLQQLQYEGNAVTLAGTAQSASAVLQAISASNYLDAPQFSASLTRTSEGKEVFRIGARLRAPNP
jgi:Tfp pilus assembly protein PilN